MMSLIDRLLTDGSGRAGTRVKVEDVRRGERFMIDTADQFVFRIAHRNCQGTMTVSDQFGGWDMLRLDLEVIIID